MLYSNTVEKIEEKSDFRDDKGLELNDYGWLLDHHKAKESDRRQMVNGMNLKPGDTLLDLGCGPGFWSEMLAEKVGPNGRVVGVDFSADYVHRATRNLKNSRYKEIITYKEGCFLDIPCDDNTFDAIFFGNTFMYIDSPEAVIEEQKRVLKKGGRIIAKDFDGSVLVLHPADPGVSLRVVTAAAVALKENPPEPYFDNFFGRKLSGLFKDFGFTDITTTPYAIQKIPPLTPEIKRYITKNAMWYLNTGRNYLSEQDIETWEAYFDPFSDRYLFDSDAFYYCMLEVMTTGTMA